MPTLPSDTSTPEPAPEPAIEPHRARAIAESFGADPARYDRTRPPYPAALISRVLDVAPGRTILDVGGGTGIVARQFQAAGCTVLGVEPDARMAEFARGTGIETEVARFEEWDPAGRTFDAVVAGTAWHWVEPVAGAEQAVRVLRPGGLFAPFHHVFQAPEEVGRALGEVYRRTIPDAPSTDQPGGSAMDLYRPHFDKTAETIRGTGGFSEPQEWHFEWQRVYTRDEWLDQMPTQGLLTRLPADRRDELLAGVGAAIDALGGRFTMHYTTVAVAAVRNAA